MNNSFYSFLGLAVRAGKVLSGEEIVLKELRKKTVYLVLVSDDASPNTRKKVQDKCTFYQIPWRTAGSRDQLGQAMGKEQRVIAGIGDKGFAEKMISLLDD
ncbi:YlxQ family RNA-binding protein [Thalassorhabdus alkalitolerans]|uniref:YlxQ family RNA-binding protein n=1 Tax=Thalassorhabdus alkalitolerans TaxID=2282697 RepID=A0ABW0YP39_9BACI